MRNVLRYVAYVLGSWLILAVLVAAGFSVYTLLSGRAEPPESVAVVEEAEEEEVDPVLAVIEKLGKRISDLEVVTVSETADEEPAEADSAAEEVMASEPEAGDGAVVTALQSTDQMGAWEIQYFSGATQMMKDWVFSSPDSSWAEFPNVDWPAGGFVAARGLEYGQELSDFCQQDQRCDFPVAARSYRSITADYLIDGVGECEEGGTGIGCAVILVNVGDVTASFRGQRVDTGHTITGLYWHGDFLNEAISALASHLAYRMVGVPSGNPASPGANCSVPTGCTGVDITFVVLSGNELLLRGHTVVRP